MTYKTEQEKFWAGDFGDAYSKRNTGEEAIAADTAFFSNVLSRSRGVKSAIEFGANIGINLKAIKRLLPNISLAAIEINTSAVRELERIEDLKVFPQSILDFEVADKYDLVIIKGVLIHINPDELPRVYDKLYQSSRKYILIAEYYNPTPVEVNYRGHTNRLFKRDFAGDIMDNYKDLKLIDYGFVYRRDPNFRQDDITWFLLEK